MTSPITATPGLLSATGRSPRGAVSRRGGPSRRSSGSLFARRPWSGPGRPGERTHQSGERSFMPDAWRCRRPIRHQPFTAEVAVKVRLGPASLPASVQDLTEFEDRPQSRLRMSRGRRSHCALPDQPSSGMQRLDTGFDLHEMLGAGAAPCGFRGGPRRSRLGGRRRRIHEDRRHDRPAGCPGLIADADIRGAVVEDGDAGSLESADRFRESKAASLVDIGALMQDAPKLAARRRCRQPGAAQERQGRWNDRSRPHDAPRQMPSAGVTSNGAPAKAGASRDFQRTGRRANAASPHFTATCRAG